jgi:hypothetical protein
MTTGRGMVITRAAAARRACRARHATCPTPTTRRDSRLASNATMMTEHLILKRAAASRSSGEWSEDEYDVLADGVVVGRIMKAAAAPARHRKFKPRPCRNYRACRDARDGDGGVRQELVAGVT